MLSITRCVDAAAVATAAADSRGPDGAAVAGCARYGEGGGARYRRRRGVDVGVALETALRSALRSVTLHMVADNAPAQPSWCRVGKKKRKKVKKR